MRGAGIPTAFLFDESSRRGTERGPGRSPGKEIVQGPDKPILVIGRKEIAGLAVFDQAEAVVLPVRYARAVRRAGGLPIVVPPLAEASFIESFLDTVDGLLLAGGDDFRSCTLKLGQEILASRGLDIPSRHGHRIRRRYPDCWGAPYLHGADGFYGLTVSIDLDGNLFSRQPRLVQKL